MERATCALCVVKVLSVVGWMLVNGWRWMLSSLLMALSWQLLKWNQIGVQIMLKLQPTGSAIWFDLAPSWLHGSWGSTDLWKLDLVLVLMDFHRRNLQGKGQHWHDVLLLPFRDRPADWGTGLCLSVAYLRMQERCFLRKLWLASRFGKILSKGWQPIPRKETFWILCSAAVVTV